MLDNQTITQIGYIITTIEALNNLQPVTQKTETVTEFADRCRECEARYGTLLVQQDELILLSYKKGYHDALQKQTGKWIDADGDNARCSCCNRCNHLYGAYCKYCGARMAESI